MAQRRIARYGRLLHTLVREAARGDAQQRSFALAAGARARHAIVRRRLVAPMERSLR
jgi:hypothetical protein